MTIVASYIKEKINHTFDMNGDFIGILILRTTSYMASYKDANKLMA